MRDAWLLLVSYYMLCILACVGCLFFWAAWPPSAINVWLNEFTSVWQKPSNLMSSGSVSYLCPDLFARCQLIWSNCMRKAAAEGNYWRIIKRLIISFWIYEQAPLSDFGLNPSPNLNSRDKAGIFSFFLLSMNNWKDPNLFVTSLICHFTPILFVPADGVNKQLNL